jgi:cysteinyl-tRNA synthetase
MKLYNTASKTIEEFTPQNPPEVKMYTCGITAYDYVQIGNIRKYVNDDILRRTLTYLGYNVKHVQNVTDVGHLVSDADEGEDKLEKGAKRTGKTVWEVAEFYTTYFYSTLDKVNVLRPSIICKATDHIEDQIALVKILLEKGNAYETSTGVFFSVDSFPRYSHLFGQNLLDKKVGVREEVVVDQEKKNPADFALWFKAVGRFKDHSMQWDSPWGKGFPGWHIECSAMSMHYLGETLDIHTGGIDHISVHHPNEIAQSEAATGKPFVKYWVHTAFLMLDSKKISKSSGDFYKIEDIEERGYDPLSLRYLYFSARYRRELNFTWASLDSAQTNLRNLRDMMISFKKTPERAVLSEEKLKQINDYREQFKIALEDDLNMPEVLSVLWKVVKSNIPSEDKYDLIIDFDQVLGLGLGSVEEKIISIPKEIAALAEERQKAKATKDFQKADEIRQKIVDAGFSVKDNPDNTSTVTKAYDNK